jgi:sporulation protein YlmC with PRC-barrel domain
MKQTTDGGEMDARGVHSLDDLRGTAIRNPGGEDLGKLEDVVIDGPRGRVAYAVLSFGGFLGMGTRRFAIPWHALQSGKSPGYLILDVPKERLEAAPGFDEDDPPLYADEQWGTEIHTYYGYQPYWS